MAQFKTKSCVIEAVQWSGKDDTNRIINWLAQQGVILTGWLFHDTDITIPTLEGPMRASPNDWIIKGLLGEFYPCKPEAFEKKYESV